MIYQKQWDKLQSALAELTRKHTIVSAWPARQKATGKSSMVLFSGTDVQHTAYSRWVRGVWEPSQGSINKVHAIFESAGV